MSGDRPEPDPSRGPRPPASVLHRPRHPQGLDPLPERPRKAGFEEWPEADEAPEATGGDRSLLGVVGQLVAAVLTVAALVALFIAGSVAFHWLIR